MEGSPAPDAHTERRGSLGAGAFSRAQWLAGQSARAAGPPPGCQSTEQPLTQSSAAPLGRSMPRRTPADPYLLTGAGRGVNMPG